MSAPTLSTVRTLPSFPSVLRIRADESTPKYHPAFSFADADVILRSNQGTLYRVYSFTLRTTSGFFATMFSLPQPKYSSQNPAEKFANRSQVPSEILDVYETTFRWKVY